MKNSFVQELGERLFSKCIENSYYNDEHDVDCLTPDFESVYELINEQKSLTPTDLKETYVSNDEDYGDPVTYTGTDLLKLAVIGDFEEDSNFHSNELKNLKMCQKLIDITKGNKNIWEDKKETESKKREGYYESDHSYKKSTCDRNTLASLVGSRTENAALHNGEEGIKIAQGISQKLRGYKGFNSSSSHQVTLTDESGHKKLQKLAGILINEKLGDVASLTDYNQKAAAIRWILYRKSGDKKLDEVIDSTLSIKDIIASKGTPLEL